MSYYVICTSTSYPCAADHQIEVTQIGVQEFAQIGVTPESLAKSVGIGFGIVLVLALVGYGAAAALRTIRLL